MPAVVAAAIVKSDWQADKAAELPHLTVAFVGKSASGEAVHLADRTANVNWRRSTRII
jgi:hypothetical protein